MGFLLDSPPLIVIFSPLVVANNYNSLKGLRRETLILVLDYTSNTKRALYTNPYTRNYKDILSYPTKSRKGPAKLSL